MFWRTKTGKPEGASVGQDSSVQDTSSLSDAMIDPTPRHHGAKPALPPASVKPLAAADLRRTIEAAALGFKTTAEIEPLTGFIGQKHAVDALALGASIRAPGFNVFVIGATGLRDRAAVLAMLQEKASVAAAPYDWVYVHDFDNVSRPKALHLPRGRARVLAKAMIEAIDDLRTGLPAAFVSEPYRAGVRTIQEEFRSAHEDAFEALQRKAQAQSIAIMRTPLGFGMAPIHEGKPVRPEVFQQLPEKMRREVDARVIGLEDELKRALTHRPIVDRARRTRLRELDEEIARMTVQTAMADAKAQFADVADVATHLDRVSEDIVRNVGLFLSSSDVGETHDQIHHQTLAKDSISAGRDQRFRRYRVNDLQGDPISQGIGEGAPVWEEPDPGLGAVLGRIGGGYESADFLSIMPGALHRANGGTLLLDARNLLAEPQTWRALKQALTTGEIRIPLSGDLGSGDRGIGAMAPLQPTPTPLDVKVVLFGDSALYQDLSANDADFLRLFRVCAEFDATIPSTRDNDAAYIGLIAALAKENGLPPLDPPAVAKLIEESARLAGDRERLSVDVDTLLGLIREASYGAQIADRRIIMAADMASALDTQNLRSFRLREAIAQSAVSIAVDGETVGHANGLAVMRHGRTVFGRPQRVTAHVRPGSGRVIDLVFSGTNRKAGVLGNIASLWGYLVGRYAQDVPLALMASVAVDEANMGSLEVALAEDDIDTDGASLAEFSALLSALAGVPIHQGLAMAGTVTQQGDVQAVRHINERIEGFFDLCKARSLTGRQGVIIPRANVRNLMVREDVVAAVKKGDFSVWAIATAEHALEILTGGTAGAPDVHGRYSGETLNGRIEMRLRAFLERPDRSDRPRAANVVKKIAEPSDLLS